MKDISEAIKMLSDGINAKQKIQDDGYDEFDYKEWQFNSNQLRSLKYARDYLIVNKLK